jgi:flagellar biosynthetic protein FliO
VTPTPLRKTWAALAAVLLALAAGFPALAQTSTSALDVTAQSVPATGATQSEDVEKRVLRRGKPGTEGSATRATTQRAAAAATGNAARPPAGTGGFDLRRLVTALAVVLLLILLARWFARRFFGVAGATRSTRAVQVLSRSTLSPKQQLMLIRVGRRLLVVGDGGGQLNTLSEITDADEVAALVGQVQDDHSARATKSFGSLFGRMQGKFGEAEQQDAEVDRRPEPAMAGPRAIDGDPEESEDPAVDAARQELSGLMDRVRMLSRQFKNS